MDGQRPCPYCAEPIRLEAIKCKHCGEMLPGAVRPASPPAEKDAEHLRLLVLGHYVVSGLTALFACIPLIHLGIGLAILLSPQSMNGGKGEPPPAVFGWLFAVMGGAFVLAGWTLAALILVAGKSIQSRRRHTFCMIVAGCSCLFMPFGTALGVCDFLVLSRPTVKPLFSPPPPPAPQG